MTTEITERYMDLLEAGRYLGIHPQSVRRLIKQGQIAARWFGRRYYIDRAWLQQFKASYDPRPGRKVIRRDLFAGQF